MSLRTTRKKGFWFTWIWYLDFEILIIKQGFFWSPNLEQSITDDLTFITHYITSKSRIVKKSILNRTKIKEQMFYINCCRQTDDKKSRPWRDLRRFQWLVFIKLSMFLLQSDVLWSLNLWYVKATCLVLILQPILHITDR